MKQRKKFNQIKSTELKTNQDTMKNFFSFLPTSSLRTQNPLSKSF